MPLGSEALGDLRHLGGLGQGVGRRVLGRGEQARPDVADDLVCGPGTVFVAEPEHLADQAPGRTMTDVKALKENAPLLRLISPEMAIYGVTVSRGDKMVVPRETVGVWPAVIDMNLHTLEHGRFFTDTDEENANPVCVIGTGIRDELFGSPQQLGYEVVPIGDDPRPLVVGIGFARHDRHDLARGQVEITLDIRRVALESNLQICPVDRNFSHFLS